jgi:hypothetical protein
MCVRLVAASMPSPDIDGFIDVPSQVTDDVAPVRPTSHMLMLVVCMSLGTAAPQLAAGPNFSLLGEEEEENEQVLSSKRVPQPENVSHDLIDVGGGPSASVATAPAPLQRVEAAPSSVDQQLI